MRAVAAARDRRRPAGRRDRPAAQGAGSSGSSTAALNPIDISIGERPLLRRHAAAAVRDGLGGRRHDEDGRRVWVRGRNGLFAELVDPSGGWIFEIPAGVDDETALGCGIAGLTAWLAVSWRTPVRPDDTVLVLGASGTLGSVAVQGAKLLGAKRVIGAARKVDLVPDAADEVFDLRSDADLPAATLIVDALWGEPIERALAAAPVGRPRRPPGPDRPGPKATLAVGLGARQGGRHPRPLALRHPARRRRGRLPRALRARARRPDRHRDRELPARPTSPRPGSARRRAARARKIVARLLDRDRVRGLRPRPRGARGGARRTAIAPPAAAPSAQRPPKTNASSVPPTVQSQPISGLASGSGAVQA